MLAEEARWLNLQLQSLRADDFPLLNVGSSTGDFRRSTQPYIDEHVFRPLSIAGRAVVHSDLKAAEGVDVAGDITTTAIQQELMARELASVLCSNLLEHLDTDAPTAAGWLDQLVAPGKVLIITCPRHFPPHPDPIDNGYRPSVAELMSLFPQYEVIAANEVRGRRAGTYYFRDARSALKFLLRLALPFVHPANWWKLVHDSWQPAAASCLVLRKNADGGWGAAAG